MTIEEEIFRQHRGKSVILDSNLLLLLLIGGFRLRLIANFKRTAKYSIEDFEVLLRFLGNFSRILTTPHVLTEVSNLANSLPEWQKQEWGEFFRVRIAQLQEAHETSAEIAQAPGFVLLGLTDAALSRLAQNTLLITDDRRLCGYLKALSIDAYNFDDLLLIRRSLHL
jgi:hypothetical protein